MRIGPYTLKNNLILAPMAGVTDRPFRRLCSEMGAGLVVSEMLSSNPKVWKTAKSLNRMNHEGESGIRSIQIAGSEPSLMAEAAQFNVERGAQIIDINMGCPAKKVNKKLAGSALLQQPELVANILDAVVKSVDVPVTLKIRTGWDVDNRNGIHIAKIAQDKGIVSIAVHGRTRTCMFKGHAEYDTIKAIKANVSIPVIANGDIKNALQAKEVLHYTGADGIMIGRAAQGNPWIFRQIEHFLSQGIQLEKPSPQEMAVISIRHVHDIYDLYGLNMGVRIARKHVGWYLDSYDPEKEFRRRFNKIDEGVLQIEALEEFFSLLSKQVNYNPCNAA
ncbi:tRNA-dihydrouridine synthase B [Glaciecola punicea ACAM 611]|uniref:tRNA-dihydrouridine synthase B n=1 Tax=Glaciecola punicea ACAM 611 TaxID=1121923 RepID=H5TAU0_9ALTE|nr:tRNA dihydrouridine synthase DusB [Glaciecola punicea]OFA31876.1 tRNA dihydrouridine synthase DusB [Glaciecola punicea]GAB55417.1 tRNA-dihydrouridine synthase B [Glaciecola punicea ACAM 611]